MREIKNDIIPFKGYKAMTLYPFLFVRKDARMSDIDYNHEYIHAVQQREMAFVLFYAWYILEWLVKLPVFGRKAYYHISFEREAYENENNSGYLADRKHFAWMRCL